jgi:ATP-dependent helicase HrpB
VLPIEPVLPAVRRGLAGHHSLVLQAPPGAGKTTLVPLALLDAPWLAGRTIVMLEPRRLATRAAAQRLAQLHGSPLGSVVGYRMRGDTRTSSATRIEVVTEGVLTRRLQRDPTLDGVGLLIFDEYHERSLDADLGLALALRTQALLRPELRLLVMSATLDGAAVAALLGDAPIVTSEGRAFPVETRHVAPRADARLESTVSAAVLDALRRDAGDILVFLPGAGEIGRVSAILEQRDLGGTIVAPLHGTLAQTDQDRAIVPDPSGRRRVVLSTPIAETSLTIEGIRVVIDSGFARRPRFSPATGMTRLETVRASRASVDQRRGRAGRTAPGVCYRLWAEHDTHQLLANTPPEITSADLAPLALDLAAAGVDDPGELQWLDAPAPAAFAQARELLRDLEALEAAGAITPLGTEMSGIPAHPRLAHMLLRARDSASAAATGTTATAADIAALLGERDVFRWSGASVDADVALRLDAIRRGEQTALPPGVQLDRDAVRRVRAESNRLRASIGVTTHSEPQPSDAAAGALLALAYPDRVAQRRPGERARFLLRNGRGAELPGAQSLSESPYIVAAELDDRRPESRIFLAAALSLDELRAQFADQIETEDLIAFDEQTLTVVARRRERLGAIVLREVSLGTPDAEQVRRVFMDAVRRRGMASLPWPEAAARLRQRMAFVARHDASWPRIDDETLTARSSEWLEPRLNGLRRFADMERVDLADALLSLLDWRQRRALDELAPTHIEVPTGSRIAVDYGDPESPALAVRLQELFGSSDTPAVFGGRVPVTLHLLSPAYRPVQVTRDLAGFWRTSYFDVRKDLRGRYPKHEWPEDPLGAQPTRRAKPRR